MLKITLEQAKYQCRIEHDDEDELLDSYIMSAYAYVSDFTGRQLFEVSVPDNVSNGVVITASINQAVLMLVGHWYANREAVAGVQMAQLPLSVHHLLQPYRLMGV